MARKEIIQLTDDIDGSVADETVTFALDGITWEIDLSAQNAADMRSRFEAYKESARKVSGRLKRGTKQAAGNSTLIRKWAQENGYAISGRGRVSGEVAQAYAAAH